MKQVIRIARMMLVLWALLSPTSGFAAGITDKGGGNENAGVEDRLGNIGGGAGLTRPELNLDGADQSTLLPEYLGRVVFGAMSLLGVIFFALMVYGGFLWLYAGGNDKRVEKAQAIIKMASIGFALTLFAGGVVQFVVYYGNQ